jgi:hypothetical protein
MGILSRHKKESQIIAEEDDDLKEIRQEFSEIRRGMGNPQDEERKLVIAINKMEENLYEEMQKLGSVQKKIAEINSMDNKEIEIEVLRRKLLKEIEDEES